MKLDPSQPLDNPRHELFAQALALGESATKAYRTAGYAAKDADTAGPRLSGNVGVQARVKWLQQQAATETVLTIQEKREFLAAIVRTPIGQVGPESPLCQKYTRTRRTAGRGEETEEWETERIEAPDKIAAIKADNDLAPETEKQGVDIVIRIGK